MLPTAVRPSAALVRVLAALAVLASLLAVPLPSAAQGLAQDEPDAPALAEDPACFDMDTTVLAQVQALREVTCHRLAVPLHHDAPDGDAAALAVVVLHAAEEPTAPPILHLSGGPGGSGVQEGLVVFGLFGDITLGAAGAARDVILLDQRGTGYSTPNLDCPEVGTGVLPGSSAWRLTADLPAPWPDAVAPPAQAFAQEPGGDAYLDAVRACHERLSAETDLNAFTTVANARDLEALRLALEEEQLVLYGTSYGTKLAQRAAALFPDSWAALVLDSPVPADANFMAEITPSFDEALRAVEATCEADERCPFDDIVDRASARILELAEAPVAVGVTEPSSGQPITTVLTPNLIASAIYQLHYIDAAPVPPLLDGLARGEDRGFAFTLGTRADSAVLAGSGGGAQDGPLPSAFGMQLSNMCAEEFATIDPAAYEQSLAEASPLAAAFGVAPFFGSLTLEVCEAAWPVTPRDDTDTFSPIDSDIPALIVTGTFDQITPASFGPRTAEGFSDAQLVEVPGGVHAPLLGLLDCGGALLSGFLADPSTPVDATCATERLPVLDAFLPDAPALGAERVAGADRYATAAATSRFTFPQGVATVVVASGEDFADALVGGSLAGGLGVPLLLTGAGHLPEVTAAGLARLPLAEVVLIGGPSAVDDATADAIGAAAGAPVQRIGGADRAETAALVAEALAGADPDQVWLATGGDFPDALAAGAAAAQAAGGEPVLLAGQELPTATRAALEALQPRVITIVGGEAVVPQAVAEAAAAAAGGAELRRLAGPDRYATAAAVAATLPPSGSRIAAVAITGADYPDALSATPLAARRAPLILLPPEGTSEAALAAMEGRVGSVVAVGGQAALPDAAVITLTAALPPLLGPPPG